MKLYEGLANVMRLNNHLLNSVLIKTLAFISSVREINIDYMIETFSKFILIKSQEKSVIKKDTLLFY